MNVVEMVLEEGDELDVVIEPFDTSHPDYVQLACLWIHIYYPDPEAERPTGSSIKEDGHFALLTKAGEKAERYVAMMLIREHGHRFPACTDDGKCMSPGYFTLWFRRKRDRRIDLTCRRCKMRVEVKRRRRDRHLRFSHSDTRKFSSENDVNGWHAFVFPDWSVEFYRNDDVLPLIEKATEEQSSHDTYVPISRTDIRPTAPPACTGGPVS